MSETVEADMDQAEQARRLIEFVTHTVLGGRRTDLTVDTPLVSSGMVDSLSLVDVLSVLEDVSGLRIPASKVRPQDLDTVTLMLATAQRLGKPRRQ
jgi:acyl carrier protein